MSNILLMRLRLFWTIAQNDLFSLTSSMLQEADLCSVTIWQKITGKPLRRYDTNK